MTKTFAQVVYSDLTPEQNAAIQTYCGDNGLAYETSESDLTWVRVLNSTSADQTSIEGAL